MSDNFKITNETGKEVYRPSTVNDIFRAMGPMITLSAERAAYNSEDLNDFFANLPLELDGKIGSSLGMFEDIPGHTYYLKLIIEDF